MYVNSFQNKYAQEICTWFKTYQVLKGTTIIPTVILTVGSQAIVKNILEILLSLSIIDLI